MTGLAWELDRDGERWRARRGKREFTVGWDEEADTLFLTVTIAAAANVEGATSQHYVASIPLLAALMLLPESEHEALRKLTEVALTETRDGGVLGPLREVVEKSIEPYPAPLSAAEMMKLAAETMPKVVRLSEDLAAAYALDGEGV